MSANETPACTWTSPDELISLLTMAIAHVRSGEASPAVLAKTIMVAIQTEVARSREDVFRSIATAMRGPTP